MPASSFGCWATGRSYGIEPLFYAYQEQPGGIAQALGLAERFVGYDRCCVLLADNLFERSLRPVGGERFAEQAPRGSGSALRRSRRSSTSATSAWPSSMASRDRPDRGEAKGAYSRYGRHRCLL